MKKRYSLLLLLFTVVFANAQMVTIPDANFKAKLLAASSTNLIAINAAGSYFKIDANNDGQIQESEAQLVSALMIGNSNIADLTGINSFSNLKTLRCPNNQLPSIDLDSLTHIETIDCYNNLLTAFNYTGTSLLYLRCYNNIISTINITAAVNLRELICYNNQLLTLNCSGLTALNTIDCHNNQLTNLNIAGVAWLINLNCNYNQLASLNFADVTNVTSFLFVQCTHNNLTSFDLSVIPYRITQADCSYNPNLTYINTKDNHTITETSFSSKTSSNNTAVPGPPPPLPSPSLSFRGTPNLQYFCADAGELAFIQNKINEAGYTNPNCQLSSTCDFTSPTTNTTIASACGSYTWTYNNQTYTASGTYTVVSGNHTEYLNLTINNSLITEPPLAPILCTTVGSSVNVSVASNITTPVYNWQYRVVSATQPNPTWITINSTNAGTVYSGYQSAILTITRTSTTLPKAGTQYRVIVSGGECGSVTSDAVNLTILGVVKAGTITSNASVCTGNDITFMLSGFVGTTVQWQSALNATGTFSNILGATGNSYTATNMQLGSNKSFRAVVANSACGTTAISAIKTITVSPLAIAGIVTGGGAVCTASSGTLKVMGYVGSIQWEYSTNGLTYFNVPTASNIPIGLPFSTTSTSGTAATYLLTNITGNIYFRAKLTSGVCQSVYTNVVQYTIATLAVAGSISSTNSTICSGTATTLTLSNAIGTIAWQKSINYTSATPTWNTIANSNMLSISTGNVAYNTAYRAMVTLGSCSTVYSGLAYVNLVPKPVAKPISTTGSNPSGLTVDSAICTSSNSKTLFVSNTNFVGTVQWQKSTVSTTSGFEDLLGSTGLSYTIQNAVTGANYFRVKYSNSCGVASFSNVMTLYYKDCSTSKSVKLIPFEVKGYPNPYTNNFTLSLTTSSDEMVQLVIYDMTGKQIERTSILPNTISELELGNNYPTGIYSVIVNQGGELKSIRMVKQ